MQFPKVISVKAIQKYKIEVHFDDSTQGVYDLSHLAGKGVFNLWEKDDNFSKVFINNESGAISWPGEIDLDTLNIYCKIQGISTDKYLQSQTNHATY
jgi:hypothetical protein